MRKSLIIATAMSALMAGTSLVAAQERDHGKAGGGAQSAPQMHAQQPQTHAPQTHAQQTSPSGGNQMRENRAGGTMGQNHTNSGKEPSQHMGQSEPRSGGKADRLDSQRGSVQNRGGVDDRRNHAQSQRDERNNSAQGKRDERSNSAQGQRDERRGTAQNNHQEGNRGAALSTEQRTKIRTTVLAEHNAPRVSRNELGIDLRVGGRIPRDRIHFRPLPLPETIVEIEPEWRGYLYFLVGDEVVVVEPDTYEVVAVLPA